MRFRIFVIAIFVFMSSKSYAQFFNIDASIGTDTKNSLIVYNINPGIGYSFSDNDYIFGGLKYQSYVLIPRSDRDDDDLWSTNTVSNFLIFAGARYIIPIIKKNKNTETERTIGIFPECKLYFNPYVPRRIKYIDDADEEISLKGEYRCQLAYSIGFGICFFEKNNDKYFALNFEYSSIDAFKTIRNLNIEGEVFNFPSKNQFSIGLSIFFW